MPHKTKLARAEYCRKWYMKNRGYCRRYATEYRNNNRDRINRNHRLWTFKNRTYVRRKQREGREKVRLEVINHYGAKCACCGEKLIGFLTIDHKNNDGAHHRKSVWSSYLPWWIKKHRFPSNFQVLCYNCNCSKRVYKICFHRIKAR